MDVKPIFPSFTLYQAFQFFGPPPTGLNRGAMYASQFPRAGRSPESTQIVSSVLRKSLARPY